MCECDGVKPERAMKVIPAIQVGSGLLGAAGLGPNRL